MALTFEKVQKKIADGGDAKIAEAKEQVSKSTGKKKKTILFIVAGVVILGVAGYFYLKNRNKGSGYTPPVQPASTRVVPEGRTAPAAVTTPPYDGVPEANYLQSTVA